MPSGIYQHKKGIYHHSEDTKKKIGMANAVNNKGKHCSPKTEFKNGDAVSAEIRKKISMASKGKIKSDECRRKLSEAHKGMKKPWAKPPHKLGEKSSHWKGDDVGYGGLHDWVRETLGKPTKCEHCGKDGLTGKDIHWANKSGKYKRDLSDWMRLCSKCHGKYDALHGHKKREKELTFYPRF